MFASLSMKTVIPPSEELPHEGDDAVWPAHFLNGVAQPSRSIFVVTEVMSDWHTIWTGCPSTVWIVRFCQACQLTVICLVVPTGAPVRSSVTGRSGLTPSTELTVQSTVLLPGDVATVERTVEIVCCVASVPMAAVGSAAIMPRMDSVVSQPALRSRRAAIARDRPTMIRHTPPPMTMIRATVCDPVSAVMKGMAGPLSTM